MNPPVSGALALAADAALGLLFLALFAALLRLIKGPSLPDRVMALDLVTSIVVGIIAVRSIATGNTSFLRVSVAIALLAFIGTAAWANYIRKGGDS